MMKREGDEWKTEKKGFSDSKLVFFYERCLFLGREGRVNSFF